MFLKEYNDSLQLIATGKYLKVKRRTLGNITMENILPKVNMRDGLKFGTWHQTYKTAKTAFTGKYIDGLEDGDIFITIMESCMKCDSTEKKNKVRGMDYGKFMMIKVLILTINYQADKITHIDRNKN